MEIQSQSGQSQPETAAPRIKTVAIAKSYGALEVFADVNLIVGKHEIVSVLGPSGCGKTTLLRCIDGLITVSAGEIFIEGEKIVKPVAGVAMVFQHFGLFPWKTVYQNIAYGLQLAGAGKAEIQERVPHFIELVGLTGFEKSYPYELSGGMQQRTGYARALALDPHTLLMDEPFGAVDAQTREILQLELLKIWRTRPTTMVFVTHSIDEAVLLGNRIVILKGRPARVFEIIDVDLPEPRDRGTLSHPRFTEIRDHVWSTLIDEARAAI